MMNRPQPQQSGFPFALYLKAKEEKRVRMEKFGDFHHVLIERFDPETKKPQPPITAVLALEQVQQMRDRLQSQIASLDALIEDMKK